MQEHIISLSRAQLENMQEHIISLSRAQLENMQEHIISLSGEQLRKHATKSTEVVWRSTGLVFQKMCRSFQESNLKILTSFRRATE
jgi:hypothetical protein